MFYGQILRSEFVLSKEPVRFLLRVWLYLSRSSAPSARADTFSAAVRTLGFSEYTHACHETYPYSPVSPGNITKVIRSWGRSRQQAPLSAGCVAGHVASVSKILLSIRRHSRRCCCLQGVHHRRLLLHTPASYRQPVQSPVGDWYGLSIQPPGRGLMPTPAPA
jgi:hypothetical protein